MSMEFTKSLVAKSLKRLMKMCDESELEPDFLTELGKLRNKVVYEQKYLTDEQFDEVCQQVLDDLEKEEEKNATDIKKD